MTQIGEQVTKMEAFMKDDPLCAGEKEPEKQGWKCRIGKKGSPGDLPVPTPARLNERMKAAGVFCPTDPPRLAKGWDLDRCGPSTFPYQSHHLIPKMHLPEHDVCVWLAANAKNQDWALIESTDYDADDARNGMALPFVSTTHQWKTACGPVEQAEVCRTMMEKTKKQLHQGSHTCEDYGEEDELHAEEAPGYLGAVDELLKVINGQTLEHVQLCEPCKKSTSRPFKIRPLSRVANAVHQAAFLMSIIITKNKRFVSRRAADYFGAGAR